MTPDNAPMIPNAPDAHNAAPLKKETLAKKGLGWIPDHPDLRDYQLDKKEIQEGGRLTREEGTSNIESLAESLLQALKKLQEIAGGDKETPKTDKELDIIIRDLESKVFGDVSFIGVKLRKILRPLPKVKDKHQRILQSFPVLSYKGDQLSEQSLYKLKTYLFMLHENGSLGKSESKIELSPEEKELQDQIDSKFNDIQPRFTWINDPEFDPVTTELLNRFQRLKGIPVTSAIGMLTYYALSKCLEPKKAEELSDSTPKSVPEVQLISVPSLIPSQIVSTLFESLIEVAAEKLVNEPEDEYYETAFFDKKFSCKGSLEEDETCKDYNHPFLKGILRRTSDCLSKKSEKSFHPSIIIESLKEDRLQLFSGSQSLSSSQREALVLERSCKVFNNEFKVIEPIVSVILKLSSPIAVHKYRDVSEAVKEGFKKFKTLSNAPLEDQNSVTATENSDMPLLAMEALRKVHQELDEGISLVVEEFRQLHLDRTDLRSRSEELLIQLNRLKNEGKPSEEISKVEETSKKETIKIAQHLEKITKELQLVKNKLRGKIAILKATLYFYFLLKKFVDYYLEIFKRSYIKVFPEYINLHFPGSTSETPVKQEEQTANIFDKREYLEVENPERLYQASVLSISDTSSDENNHSENTQLEIFPTENLQIPVLVSLAKIHDLNYLDKRTHAYLFLPGVVDLSFWCTPVEDQATIQSCTAIAGVALMEYFINRSKGKYTDLSSLFLYKVTRQKMNLYGDVGASLRETIKAMALFGVPPESAWEYDPTRVDEEPPQFCYSYAQNYQALKYFRLDYAGISREALLFQIKAVLAAGFPCMFGFTIYTSAYEDTNAQEGWIPFPDASRDKVVGGHAVVAVGYDDYKLIRQADRKDYSQGGILIRNCWGTKWGNGGYGWIPYHYVRQGLTRDWWSLLKAEWFESGLLGVGSNSGEQKYKGTSR